MNEKYFIWIFSVIPTTQNKGSVHIKKKRKSYDVTSRPKYEQIVKYVNNYFVKPYFLYGLE